MPPMLDVSAEVRAEIGEEEATRLLAGENAPGAYDCTSCRTPGDTGQERTSTVLFVSDETAVLAFAHATCIPSQVVPVSEEQLQGAVRSITADDASGGPAAGPADAVPEAGSAEAPRQAVLGITCGLVLVEGTLRAALVVEPTGAISRPGAEADGDDFLPLMIEQGFMPQLDLAVPPPALTGWSVLLAMGQLHAVLQPGAPSGPSTAWWQAHQPLQVSDGWRNAVNRTNEVYVYAAPADSIGRQPREDLMRVALERACNRGLLVAGTMRLSGT
ncbi:hypothetical protein QMK19_15760 [Streptomyces sp. H10-C2]|uniref:hypothetical protein n=1 Tax=unclassified Streptomyces TaxID=2593676 RepID=UPI0024BBB67C|nr:MULTISPECIES: hypothetical protein [unclassified Streptomyces]MDJ0343161.1 hypothetical protein [Streptomyces sp. PH10-H1]MDJ0371103.1 hypothetical protein [Streptomyces sp. H10-C2]